MLRCGFRLIFAGLALSGLCLGSPAFATPAPSSTTVAATTSSAKTKTGVKKTHKKSAATKKSVKTKSSHHHSKASSHEPKPVPVPAVNNNPQDYMTHAQTQTLAANLTQISSANNQDFINGGFNQQIKVRLVGYQSSVCANAQAQIGKAYQWGVEDPETGFDCSGLSQFVYAEEGIQIPRTAAEQYHSLQPVKNLQEGDLVFFRTHNNSRKISHVGIYVGDGYFVHAPRTGETIRMSSLSDPYWKKNYAGARRVLTNNTIANTVALEQQSDGDS